MDLYPALFINLFATCHFVPVFYVFYSVLDSPDVDVLELSIKITSKGDLLEYSVKKLAQVQDDFPGKNVNKESPKIKQETDRMTHDILFSALGKVMPDQIEPPTWDWGKLLDLFFRHWNFCPLYFADQ